MEKVQQFICDYNSKLDKLNQQISTCSTRNEELQLEIRFIKEVEMNEAIEKRVLEDNELMETKLKKKLNSLEEELQKSSEEFLVLNNVLQNFKIKSAEEVKKLHSIFTDERQLVERKAYAKMMHQKYLYIQAIMKEAEALHEVNKLDMEVQTIEFNAGRRNYIYTGIEVKSADVPTSAGRFNDVYLALSPQEVYILVKKLPIDLKYLEAFKHKKDL
ncbi:hypothetical protein RJD24_14635 [Bacillaceae bacterium IKA-2]|nr:hypothetical protein RJD24_14635 [Bacillaceae bacterium IKA-2]